MNSLRSYSISYLVAQPKVETRYNQKNLHAFQPFRAEPKVIDRREIMPTSPTECLLSAKQVQAYNEGDNADMPAGLSFLCILCECLVYCLQFISLFLVDTLSVHT